MAHDIPIVPIQETAVRPFDMALAYPRPEQETVQSRISQLTQLGVRRLVFDGPLQIEGLRLLGKGISAIVVSAVTDTGKIAVKIRRVDSRRDDMRQESEMLKLANDAGVGPALLSSTRDVLAMELVQGQNLPTWLSTLKGRGRKNRVRTVLKQLLVQCRKLDAIGLDHGELSRAHKNILVTSDDHPTILDFESASLSRRPKNFTSLTQYLFLGGGVTRKVRRVIGPVDCEKVLKSLRNYKASGADAFDSTLALLNLQPSTRNEQHAP